MYYRFKKGMKSTLITMNFDSIITGRHLVYNYFRLGSSVRNTVFGILYLKHFLNVFYTAF